MLDRRIVGRLIPRYDLDLKELRPELACNEQPTLGGVIRNPVNPLSPVLSKKNPSRKINPCVYASPSCGQTFTTR